MSGIQAWDDTPSMEEQFGQSSKGPASMREGETVMTPNRQALRLSVLRDILRSGGTDNWGHLKSHGHHWMTLLACVKRGDLRRDGHRWFNITEAGRAAILSGTKE